MKRFAGILLTAWLVATSAAAEVKWETNLDQAKLRARASGKPILLMHLFGRLDQEFT